MADDDTMTGDGGCCRTWLTTVTDAPDAPPASELPTLQRERDDY